MTRKKKGLNTKQSNAKYAALVRAKKAEKATAYWTGPRCRYCGYSHRKDSWSCPGAY